MDDAVPHSIWLCPEAGCARDLQAVITGLARVSGTDAFAPHVTLLGDLHGPPERSLALCRRLWTSGPLTARVTAVSTSDAYFMALFLDVALTPDPAQTRDAIGAALGVEPGGFRPHLSLAYGPARALRDPALAADLSARHLGGEIRLDTLAVVASTRHRPIRDWHVLQAIAL